MLSNTHFTCFCPEIGIWYHKEVREITGDRTNADNERLDFDLRAYFYVKRGWHSDDRMMVW